mgnify:CR=1 FL=1
MDKKGDISMNMIIMAIIALLVLAIIAYLIFTQLGAVEEGSSCQAIEGTCATSCQDVTGKPIRSAAGQCDGENEFCCVALSTT